MNQILKNIGHRVLLATVLTCVLTMPPIAAADTVNSFYLISVDDNGLYQVSTELEQPELMGTVGVGTDLYELVDTGEHLITIYRATDMLLTIRKDDASVVCYSGIVI